MTVWSLCRRDLDHRGALDDPLPGTSPGNAGRNAPHQMTESIGTYSCCGLHTCDGSRSRCC